MTATKILQLACNEIGTTATGENNVKYNTAYYGREINASGYAWCAVFVWWCFQQAGASGLYYGGNKTAYCPTLLAYHTQQGQAVSAYEPGDIIFFNFSGKSNAAHVGICERFDGANITTIDGNTSTTSEAGGGTVARRTRNKSYIVGAYRPGYQEEEEEVTQEQFNTMFATAMTSYLATQDAKAVSDWAKTELAEAVTAGITDGKAPQGAVTREQAAIMALRAMKAAAPEGEK